MNVEKVMYVCMDCKKTNTIVDHNIVCKHCGCRILMKTRTNKIVEHLAR